MRAALFSDYHANGFCEVTRDGAVREHYRTLVDRLDSFGPEELQRRTALIESLFRRQGVTFAVAGDEAGAERTWPLDLIPRIIPASEWDPVAKGLAQRVTALNAFLEDIYVGEQAVIRDGVVPRWVVESSSGYLPECHGIAVPHGARSVVSGIDIVRDGEGTYRVLEDNLRVPSGVSYVLENRLTMTRVLPLAFSRHRVRPVNHYGVALLETLRAVAPHGVDEPTVVVLTPGPNNSAYFEHAFLARQMGVELVEGRDLVCVDGRAYLRTTTGLERVDVIYRRVGDEWMDPVVFRTDSALGVPGLLEAVREGTVTLANALGNGVADDKGVYPFVPDMIRYYLGVEPLLPNVTTYLPWEPDQLDHVLANIGNLVVKPVAEAGGYGIVIGPAASDFELGAAAEALRQDPRGYIAQEVVQLSTHPTFVDGGLGPRHIDLRPFVLAGADVSVVPGGLTRVALREGSLVVNSSAGGGSKDTWVLEA